MDKVTEENNPKYIYIYIYMYILDLNNNSELEKITRYHGSRKRSDAICGAKLLIMRKARHERSQKHKGGVYLTSDRFEMY